MNYLGDPKQQKFGQKSKIRCQQDYAPSQDGRGESFLASSAPHGSWCFLACGSITPTSAFVFMAFFSVCL